jgi:hypothetical protein
MNKFWFGWLAGLVTAVAFVALMGLIAIMIPQGHATPHATTDSGDQKGNMGMYDDAYGPAFGDTPYNAGMQMPWGVCMKPAIVIGVHERPDGVIEDTYADDKDVIWRCMQAHPTGEPISPDKAPIIYCIHQNKPQLSNGGTPMTCYHDYRVIFRTYENEWGGSPIIGPDEVQYVP